MFASLRSLLFSEFGGFGNYQSNTPLAMSCKVFKTEGVSPTHMIQSFYDFDSCRGTV